MADQNDVPDSSNFFASLATELSKEQVARLYERRGWAVRKCTWVDFEIRCPWAELIIDGESPILLHGPVAQVLLNVEAILAPLREAGVSYTAECHGEAAELLRKDEWHAGNSV
jgi:hypothetical protein